MITRIELTNFMSHRHTVIEPAAGLTVLIGPNNCGKSAVVAALQIASQNDKSTYVMRHGAKECSVRIETDDGHVIEWIRKGSPRYLIDGQLFDRLKESGRPEELQRVLRLPRVEANDEQFDVHFGEQKSPIFLLDKSGSYAARFFASSSDAHRLVAMQQRHKQKVGEAKRDKNRLDAESKRHNAELELLEPVTGIDHRLEQVELAYAELTRLAVWIQQAERDLAELRASLATEVRHRAEAASMARLAAPPEMAPTEPLADLAHQINVAGAEVVRLSVEFGILAELSPPPTLADTHALDCIVTALDQAQIAQQRAIAVHGALHPLDFPPALDDVETLARQIADLANFAYRLQHQQAALRSMAELVAPPALEDTQPLDNLVRQFIQSRHQVELGQRRSGSLRALSEPPVLPDPTFLERHIEQLRAASDRLTLWQDRTALLAAVAVPPQPQDEAPLIEFLKQFTVADKALQSCQRQLAQADQQLAAATADLQTWVAEHGTCPTCGGPIDPEQFVAHAAAGMGGHRHD